MKQPWHRRVRHTVAHSLKVRLVLVFLLLAGAMAFTFVSSLQKAFAVGWRDAARPLLMDYVDHLAAEITPDPNRPPSVERARAIAQRLPLTIRIDGPQVQWQSHPNQPRPEWQRDQVGSEDAWLRERWGGDKDWSRLLRRTTADGHSIEFGIDDGAFDHRSRLMGYTLAALLLLTLFAFLYIRRLLRPLDDIRAGAQRFGAGDFVQPIAVKRPHHPDELGELATTINTMGADIHQMLEAKRTLLLAISHELRSPLTRARLNTELLPETPELQPSREALLRDLALMRDLVTDLLESERLASPHAALNREPTDIAALVVEVVAGLDGAPAVTLLLPADLPPMALDRTRLRLLLRNLLDNALRHSEGAPQPPTLQVTRQDDGTVSIRVRDFGPGVPPHQLPHLAQPFYRPDAARTREGGGVGLGLYLCKLVALAHGGTFTVRNAQPGLEGCVVVPVFAI